MTHRLIALITLAFVACRTGRGTAAGPGGEARVGEVTPVGQRATRGNVDAVRAVVNGHSRELRYCYEEGLRKDPKLGGALTIAVTIDRAGNATAVELADRASGWGGAGAAAAESCMTRQVRAWLFPNASAGTYRFPVRLSR